MRLHIFSVYDSKAEAFLPPFFYGTKGQAMRSFGDAVNEEGHQFRKHAADYTLFYVGVFDQDEGAFDVTAPVSLGNAVTFLLEEV